MIILYRGTPRKSSVLIKFFYFFSKKNRCLLESSTPFKTKKKTVTLLTDSFVNY
nr:MAG TPA: hypothetical protein [Caudoviricetes sp.]